MAIFHLHGHRCFKDGFPSSMVGVEPSFPWHGPGNGCSSLHCHGAAISVPVELSWREPGGHLFVFFGFFSTNFFECPKIAGRFGSRKGIGCLKPFWIKQLLKHVVFLPALSDILQFFGGANHLFCDDCHEMDPTPLREILLVLADYWELLGTYFWIPSNYAWGNRGFTWLKGIVTGLLQAQRYRTCIYTYTYPSCSIMCCKTWIPCAV